MEPGLNSSPPEKRLIFIFDILLPWFLMEYDLVTWKRGEPPERDGDHAWSRAVSQETRGGVFTQVARVELCPESYDLLKT